MNAPIGMRAAAIAALGAFALLLTGCFMAPGKFASELVLNRDGSFNFSYEGEIFFLGLSKLAQMDAAKDTFEAEACYDDDYEARDCSADELAEQRAQWEAGAEERAAKAQQEAQQMAKLMGGIDPTDPEAAEELRSLLLRHKGWTRVENKGDGVFDVSYSASGQLSHDMMFPVIEGFPSANLFVQVILRDDNVVRVNAPAFSAQDDTNPMGSMMGGMAGLAAVGAAKGGRGDLPDMPTMDGTFTIVTNGRILANNTDEGPSQSGATSRLEWKVDQRSKSAPTALIKLGD